MQKKETKKVKSGRFINVLTGGGIGLGIMLFLLAIIAALCSAGKISMGAGEKGIILAAVMGTFAGGLIAVKRNKSKALLTGALTGVAAAIPMIVGRAFFCSEGFMNVQFITCFLATAGGGAMGGVAGARKKKKRR